MLQIEKLGAAYGEAEVLRDVSLTVASGEILCLLGRNGAGKTTLIKAIMGLVRRTGGDIRIDGESIAALPAHEAPKRGIGYIPQGRRLFADLTVCENIEVGLMTRGRGAETRERVLTMFPRLRERYHQRAGSLSGGEQQMLATARALCLEPSVLLMDEPTEGLQPSMIDLIRKVASNLRAEGVAILLVEQRVDAVLEIADRVAFLENGRLQAVLPAAEIKRDASLLARYVGV